MADKTQSWLKEARRIAPLPGAKPSFTPSDVSRKREVVQAEVNRIRKESNSKAGKS